MVSRPYVNDIVLITELKEKINRKEKLDIRTQVLEIYLNGKFYFMVIRIMICTMQVLFFILGKNFITNFKIK